MKALILLCLFFAACGEDESIPAPPMESGKVIRDNKYFQYTKNGDGTWTVKVFDYEGDQ